MNKYMSVTITNCEGSSLQRGHLYYSDDELGIVISTPVSHEAGMQYLRKLEKLLQRPAALSINPYNTEISYKELHGFIGRE